MMSGGKAVAGENPTKSERLHFKKLHKPELKNDPAQLLASAIHALMEYANEIWTHYVL